MLLSTLFHKKIYENGRFLGICDGVFFSKKSHHIKALSCQGDKAQSCLSFAQIDYVTDIIRLKKYACYRTDTLDKFSPCLPVYDDGGAYLGKAVDISLSNSQAITLILESGITLSAALIQSCKDAVIVRKKPPFPLFCPIPAPTKGIIATKNAPDGFITKRTLSTAIEQGNLIRLTLSLLSSNGVFCGEF